MRIEMKFPSGKDFERLISEMDKKVSTGCCVMPGAGRWPSCRRICSKTPATTS